MLYYIIIAQQYHCVDFVYSVLPAAFVYQIHYKKYSVIMTKVEFERLLANCNSITMRSMYRSVVNFALVFYFYFLFNTNCMHAH